MAYYNNNSCGCRNNKCGEMGCKRSNYSCMKPVECEYKKPTCGCMREEKCEYEKPRCGYMKEEKCEYEKPRCGYMKEEKCECEKPRCGCMKEEKNECKEDCTCQEFMRVYDWYNCICDKAYREFEDAEGHLCDTINYMKKGMEYNCKAKEISEYIEAYLDSLQVDMEDSCSCKKPCKDTCDTHYDCGMMCPDSCNTINVCNPCNDYKAGMGCGMRESCSTCKFCEVSAQDCEMQCGCKKEYACKDECTCKKACSCKKVDPCKKMREELEDMKEELYALQKESLMHTQEAVETLAKAKKMVKCLNEMKCKVANSCYPKC